VERNVAGDPMSAQLSAGKHGLSGELWGKKTADLAREVVAIADQGLARLKEDRDLLTPLIDQVNSGESPADRLIRAWEQDPRPESFLAACAY
jgi:hypothetical protein